MIATILTYSVFAGLTYFATELWQVATLRFLAMGVGGECNVAAALVAEVFPNMLGHMLPGFSMLQVWCVL